MTETVRLDIPVLLPGVPDDQDACVARVTGLLEAREGVQRIYITHEADGVQTEHEVGQHPSDATRNNAALCVHFDAERISLAQILAVAKSAGATVAERYAHETIAFHSVGAEDEGRRIESAVRSLTGVTAAVVNFPAQIVRVEFDTTVLQLPAILERLREIDAMPNVPEAFRTGTQSLQGIAPTSPAASDADSTIVTPHNSWYSRNRELAWSLIAGALALLGWLTGRPGMDGSTLSIVLYGGAYVFGAWDLVGHLIKDLRRGEFHFNIDLLMVVAAIGAATIGAWPEGALLLFLFSLGHALEHYALGRARNAIKALADLAPQNATVRRNGTDRIVPIAEVQPGDLVVVKPGDRFAVDGIVREGTSSVNQAPITGESVPVDKVVTDHVFAGSVNGEGLIIVEVSAAVGDRTIDRVITLVAEASTQKAATQQFTDRFERVFVPLVLVADVILIAAPPLLGVWTWSESFYRAMALLVAASPCALALGTPATVLAGIAQAARNGVLIKGGAHLEALGSIEVVALDKTGTITKGEPAVTDALPADGIDATTLLAAAAAVEQHSQHPLAKAVVRAAVARGIAFRNADGVQSITGRGVRGRVDGVVIEVGHLSLFADALEPPTSFIEQSVAGLEAAGRTTMVVRAVGQDVEWLGVVGLADEPRVGVREILFALKSLGIRRIVMLTGDNAGVAAAVARTVGIDEVRASLMPEDKVTAIKEFAQTGSVAMVGDGVNDAPALAHATVGIAMGAAGTAVALETADVALMGDDLSRLPFAVGLSRRARSVIRQNLYLSLGVIALLAVSTITGWAGIGAAVIVHEGSTLVVIANALRLLRYRPAS